MYIHSARPTPIKRTHPDYTQDTPGLVFIDYLAYPAPQTIHVLKLYTAMEQSHPRPNIAHWPHTPYAATWHVTMCHTTSTYHHQQEYTQRMRSTLLLKYVYYLLLRYDPSPYMKTSTHRLATQDTPVCSGIRRRLSEPTTRTRTQHQLEESVRDAHWGAHTSKSIMLSPTHHMTQANNSL